MKRLSQLSVLQVSALVGCITSSAWLLVSSSFPVRELDSLLSRFISISVVICILGILVSGSFPRIAIGLFLFAFLGFGYVEINSSLLKLYFLNAERHTDLRLILYYIVWGVMPGLVFAGVIRSFMEGKKDAEQAVSGQPEEP